MWSEEKNEFVELCDYEIWKVEELRMLSRGEISDLFKDYNKQYNTVGGRSYFICQWYRCKVYIGKGL